MVLTCLCHRGFHLWIVWWLNKWMLLTQARTNCFIDRSIVLKMHLYLYICRLYLCHCHRHMYSQLWWKQFKNSKVALTFCRNTLAYLGNARLVEDRTSHMDLEWFSSPLRCPQLGNCLCIQALKGNESETLSSPWLYLSQLSIGWRNNVLSSLNLRA